MGKGILFVKSIPFPIPPPLQKLWVGWGEYNDNKLHS